MEWLEGLETDTLLQAMEQQLQPDLPTFSVQQLFEQLLNGDLQLDLGQLLQQLACCFVCGNCTDGLFGAVDFTGNCFCGASPVGEQFFQRQYTEGNWFGDTIDCGIVDFAKQPADFAGMPGCH